MASRITIYTTYITLWGDCKIEKNWINVFNTYIVSAPMYNYLSENCKFENDLTKSNENIIKISFFMYCFNFIQPMENTLIIIRLKNHSRNFLLK